MKSGKICMCYIQLMAREGSEICVQTWILSSIFFDVVNKNSFSGSILFMTFSVESCCMATNMTCNAMNLQWLLFEDLRTIYPLPKKQPTSCKCDNLPSHTHIRNDHKLFATTENCYRVSVHACNNITWTSISIIQLFGIQWSVYPQEFVRCLVFAEIYFVGYPVFAQIYFVGFCKKGKETIRKKRKEN